MTLIPLVKENQLKPFQILELANKDFFRAGITTILSDIKEHMLSVKKRKSKKKHRTKRTRRKL